MRPNRQPSGRPLLRRRNRFDVVFHWGTSGRFQVTSLPTCSPTGPELAAQLRELATRIETFEARTPAQGEDAHVDA